MLKLILTFVIAGFFMQAQAQNLRPIDFEAEYKADTLNRSVTYTSSGKLFETNTEILEAALPDPVMKYMNENYQDNKVNETSEIIDENGIVTYNTKIKGMDLTFDSEGNFIKVVNN
jgi:hypothetical protein